MQYFLSGDIGGTKTLLQISAAGGKQPLLQKSFASAEHDGLEKMVSILLAEAKVSTVEAACFALAGPVNGRVVKLTNLPWAVDGDALEAKFGIHQVQLLNDFEAAGYGIEALQSEDLLILQQGKPHQAGMRLVVGAGTGLGVALLTQQGERYQVHASEGGHMDFAPNDEMQAQLLEYLRQQYGHVSYERIVSGPGLLTIYQFMRHHGVAEPSARLLSALAENEDASVITHFATHENETIARLALELFFAVYGAFVGNLALASLPRGGIYVAGGISAKLQSHFVHSQFMQALRDKGRFATLMESLPVQVVKNEQLGLMGANLIATRL